MRKLFSLILFLILFSAQLLAYDAEVGGIYYNFSGDEAEVTYKAENAGGNYSGNIIIPESFIYEGRTYYVTGIGNNAFQGSAMLNSVIIPVSVLRIGDWAFCECSGLTSIKLPEEVSYIGVGAFEGCSSISSINIPGGVTSISDQVFFGCSSLLSVTIPEGVTTIGKNSFYGCRNLTSVTIPENVTSIAFGAFRDCENISTFDIPDNLSQIGYDAFRGTSWFENQEDGMVYAGKVAYKYKGKMPEGTQVCIKEGTTGISQDAFNSCDGLISVSIPRSVTYIAYSILYNCPKIVSMNVEQGNSVYDSRNSCNAIIETGTNILIAGCRNTIIPEGILRIGDGAFWHTSSLASIAIPESVKSIGSRAFSGCRGLEFIAIPDSVTSIETEAFSETRSLKSICIGSGVTSIGASAFYNSNLTTIVCYAENPPSCGINVFAGSTIEQCGTLYVPKGAKEAYCVADVWRDFANIKDMAGTETIINEIRVDRPEIDNTIYDLQGRKVNPKSKKGIYIQDGKKVVR